MGMLVTASDGPYPAYLPGWSALQLHTRIEQIPHDIVTIGSPSRKFAYQGNNNSNCGLS